MGWAGLWWLNIRTIKNWKIEIYVGERDWEPGRNSGRLRYIPYPSRLWVKNLCLPLIGREIHQCANFLRQMWFKKRLGIWQVTSLFFIQIWLRIECTLLRIECTLMKTFQSNVFQNANAFIEIKHNFEKKKCWMKLHFCHNIYSYIIYFT